MRTREPVTAEAAPRARFSQLSQAELERALGSGAGGLTSAQAAERLSRYGPNVISAHRRYGLLRKAAERFRNPLVLILIAAALISALTGEIGSFVIISTIILL